MLKQVISEMVKNAADEIGFEYCEGCVEQVLADMEHGYGITVDMEGPITWQLMSTLTDVIATWQKDTRINFC
jgi:hypothetical protein